MEERSVQIFIPYERSFRIVFSEEWLVGERPLLPNILGQLAPVGVKLPIFARSTSAVTPSEKSSINTNRKSTMHFPMSLRWSSYAAPKLHKGGLKKGKTAVFCVKSHFAWRKSATKFLCVKTVSDKVVRHSLAYLSMQKWLLGDVPIYAKIWWICFTRLQCADFRSFFRPYCLI